MKLKKLVTMLLAISASTLMFATPAQAALVGRDINGQAVANASSVFLYDTDLNITWLRDANASATAGNTNDPWGTGFGGNMDWNAANVWANTLVVGAFSGWRLPTTLLPDPSCSNSDSSGMNCSGSEMGHLFYTELGNKAGELMSNTGDFQNLQSSTYWSGTDFATPGNVWYFFMGGGQEGGLSGAQGAHSKTQYESLAMAVRSGDVASRQDGGCSLAAPGPCSNNVPEPTSIVLMGLGLMGLVAQRRRKVSGN